MPGKTRFDIKNEKEMREHAEECAAALICCAAESKQGCLQLMIHGVKINSIDLGDWVVTVERASGTVH